MRAVFLAEGFEQTEALAPVDALRRAKKEVRTVGIGGREITSSHGVTVRCDLADSEFAPGAELEMIVLPGGLPGTLNLEKSPVVQGAIDFCLEREIPIAAICAAPSILGHRGLLDGRRATANPGFQDQLGKAVCTGEAVCRDGRFTTGRGAGVAVEFGLALVEQLCGREAMEAVKASMAI